MNQNPDVMDKYHEEIFTYNKIQMNTTNIFRINLSNFRILITSYYVVKNI